MMKPISRDKVRDIVALLMKGKSSRVVAKSLGFSQSTVNRVRKKHCSNLELPKRGAPKILSTSERRRAVRLVTVGGLETAVEAAKVLREGREVGFCDNTLRSALRDVGLSACRGRYKPVKMQGVKHAAANAKEKVGNMTAKVEEKMDKGKASAAEKTDKAMADDKVGKLEAKERKHEREGQAERVKDQKKVENAQEVSNIKQDVDNRHAAADHAYKHPETVPTANV